MSGHNEDVPRFDLVANARDSLTHAVEHLTANSNLPTAGDIKRSTLDITHVMELLLKERLRRVHPAFILQDVDKYPSSSANTVNADTAIRRFVRIGDVDLGEDAINDICRAGQLRNRIQHYEFELNVEAQKAVVGRLVAFVLDFAKRHLDMDLAADLGVDQFSPLARLAEFWRVHSELLEQRLRQELGEAGVIECPYCGATTYQLSRRECALCEYAGAPLQCARCGAWTHYASDLSGTHVCYVCLRAVMVRIRALRKHPDGSTAIVTLQVPGPEAQNVCWAPEWVKILGVTIVGAPLGDESRDSEKGD